MDEKAVELRCVGQDAARRTARSQRDLIPITQENGLITTGEAHVYIVKGKGQVVDVNTESSTGTITLLWTVHSVEKLMRLATCATRPPSATRRLHQFWHFKEQTEYGKVARELNNNAQVLSTLDKTPQGRMSFTGAFTIRTFNLINIVDEIRSCRSSSLWVMDDPTECKRQRGGRV
jgi:predicted lipoprotein